ncbi:MAG: KpsF/GutQ family sugar-phosphate isomerase [Rhodospirillaceae bacterium]|nr:MAG: KpsF/GutQ family sugar-phosphate isomerase [Rhodospirillaceae bacterium]
MKAKTKPDSTPDGLAAARRVFAMEAEGISRFAASLGQEFTDALDRLAAVTGRVVVTGIGKSGHIARKIAATLASVGTPAFFVHPAEASHGDLGMITPKDAVLALSNSGETKELADLLAYTRRFAIPLIAVTGKANSSLAETADVTLLLPGAPEACPFGLAPTTSTTVMLALGDALAVALLERKGFTADAFQVLHPGGQLGRNLLRVSDVMHGGEKIPLVDRDAPMADALLTMTMCSFGCIGVLQNDVKLIGIITDGDLRRHMGDLLEKTAADVMTGNPKTIRPNALAAEALGYMNAKTITSLFVVEDARPVGILHIHDCLRAGIA